MSTQKSHVVTIKDLDVNGKVISESLWCVGPAVALSVRTSCITATGVAVQNVPKIAQKVEVTHQELNNPGLDTLSGEALMAGLSVSRSVLQVNGQPCLLLRNKWIWPSHKGLSVQKALTLLAGRTDNVSQTILQFINTLPVIPVATETKTPRDVVSRKGKRLTPVVPEQTTSFVAPNPAPSTTVVPPVASSLNEAKHQPTLTEVKTSSPSLESLSDAEFFASASLSSQPQDSTGEDTLAPVVLSTLTGIPISQFNGSAASIPADDREGLTEYPVPGRPDLVYLQVGRKYLLSDGTMSLSRADCWTVK